MTFSKQNLSKVERRKQGKKEFFYYKDKININEIIVNLVLYNIPHFFLLMKVTLLVSKLAPQM